MTSELVTMTNGTVELGFAADFGPRVMHYGFVGEENVFGVFPDLKVDTVLGQWRVYGGHRFWIAPEANPLSYAPDNDLIEIIGLGSLATKLVQSPDATGLQKEIQIDLAPQGTEVTLTHRVTNVGSATKEIAAWTMTVFRGGTMYVPLEPYRSHAEALLPTQPLVLWPFTDLKDPRLDLGRRAVTLSSEPLSTEPNKIGIGNKREWAARHQGTTLFVKRFPYLEGEAYPDFGVNTELYVEGEFMELESLGPLRKLAQGESTTHVERWNLIRNIGVDEIPDRF